MAYAMPYASIPREKLKLVKRLAHGGFGTVYKAIFDNQVVAAKRVERDEGEIELKFLSELDHPNIVKLLGMVDNEVDVDIILEFCDGGSLRDYLNGHRGAQLGQRFYDWTKQAGRPIAYLKARQVVHKDIKSPNYLITNGNILKLCDFGLAKVIDATITSATERASYQWMAPELLKDNTLSPTYDIFAYGVVVWELWTTDPPFEGCEPLNVMYRICHNNERPKIPPDCPKPIADLMRQCWETDWKKRPSMEQAISRLQAAEQLTSFITGPWELETEFGHQDGPGKLRKAFDIAVSPTGDIAVLDLLNDNVCVYSNDKTYKFHLDLWQGMNAGVSPRPWHVTVNAEGIIYVTCNCYVLMYTTQSEYKGRWVAMSPDNNPSDAKPETPLSGVTIADNGQVLVGKKHNNPWYVSKHGQDGSHIASFKTTIAPLNLAATSHNTIIIGSSYNGYHEHFVQIVDSAGHVLRTIDVNRPGPFRHTRGICCHNDIMFVCNTDAKDKHEISCFSVLTGDYLGSIPVRNIPLGVTIAKDTGKLLAACEDTVVLEYRKQVQVHKCSP